MSDHKSPGRVGTVLLITHDSIISRQIHLSVKDGNFSLPQGVTRHGLRAVDMAGREPSRGSACPASSDQFDCFLIDYAALITRFSVIPAIKASATIAALCVRVPID